MSLTLVINSINKYDSYDMTHIYKLIQRKNVLENFQIFISQERHIIISIGSAYCLRSYSSNENRYKVKI